MTPDQRAAAERLVAEHPTLFMNDLPDWCDDAFYLLRELLAEPQGGPVAWHVCSVNSDGSLSLEFAASWEESAHEHINDAINEYDIDGATSWVVRPVYAAPQQRKPLSADQIRDAVNDHAFWATSKNFIFLIARAIERAHGITGEPT